MSANQGVMQHPARRPCAIHSTDNSKAPADALRCMPCRFEVPAIFHAAALQSERPWRHGESKQNCRRMCRQPAKPAAMHWCAAAERVTTTATLSRKLGTGVKYLPFKTCTYRPKCAPGFRESQHKIQALACIDPLRGGWPPPRCKLQPVPLRVASFVVCDFLKVLLLLCVVSRAVLCLLGHGCSTGRRPDST